MANKFNNTNNTESNEYAGINLEIEVNGEFINLGSLFITNKNATAISKRVYELIESGELAPNKPNLRIKSTFNSEAAKSSEVDADAF